MGKLIEKKNEKKTACRTVLFIICLVGMIFCLTGCGASEKKLPGTEDASLLKPFLGGWQCEETPL